MILDVGCGDKPRGDVNVDLLVPDSKKDWNLDVSGYKNFVKADIRFLPFRSRLFDLVYCSHLMEHIPDYEKALSELKRVSRRYVAVIVPWSALLWIYDIFFNLGAFPEAWRWLKKHHVNYWNMDPFKTGSFKIRFKKAEWHHDWHRKNKFKMLASRIPLPYETYTLWDVS